jgi:rod shape-determining protein MreC
MRGIVYFILRHGHILLFLLLELVSLNLVIRFNPYQRNLFIKTSNAVAGWVYAKYDGTIQYLKLRQLVESTIDENARLKEQLPVFQTGKIAGDTFISDSFYSQHYYLLPAKVVNNSINSYNNFITLNKGSLDGVEKGMGVITDKGVVGIVTNTSDGFARVISFLNRNIRISASVKRNGFFGSLVWEGSDPWNARLLDVPKHADLEIGDTIITSGYSSIFPKGLITGRISEFDIQEGSNFYNIEVQLSQDMSRLDYVYVVNNLKRDEQLILEGEVMDE